MQKQREITVGPGDTKAKVERQEFDTVREEWNEYRLKSGVIVRFKSVLKNVYWVLDAEGKHAYTSDGDPHIVVQSSNMLAIHEEGEGP